MRAMRPEAARSIPCPESAAPAQYSGRAAARAGAAGGVPAAGAAARIRAMPAPPPPASVISHAELGAALAGLRCSVGASDLHGSLTGFLCGGGVATSSTWLQRLALQAETDGLGAEPLLQRLFQECRAQLGDAQLGFEPLLPDAEQPLALRAEAMVEWCRGFLGGLGLAGVDASRGLSADAAEILHDLGTIAASQFDYDDAEEDESSLTEIVEFLRVAVLLLHAELQGAPPRRATVH